MAARRRKYRGGGEIGGAWFSSVGSFFSRGRDGKRGGSCDLDGELADVGAGFCEGLVEPGERLRAVSGGIVFDEVVEKVPHEAATGIVACDGVRGEIAGASKLYHVA